ncbi:MAG: hypothetical protein ACT4PW_14460 [Acidimicrobiia bacterium]
MTDLPSLPTPDQSAGLLGGGDFLARLDRWAAEARSDDAAAARSRRRWLDQAAQESATFAGVLLDLAESRVPVVVQGVGGRRHRGTIEVVGADFCGLRPDTGPEVLLSFAATGAVWPETGTSGPVGDRVVHLDANLADALAVLAADRPRVLVVTTTGDGLSGELRSMGRDVVSVRLDGAGRLAYLAVGAIAELKRV